MSPETIALILTTIGGVTAAVKAIAEARKAKHEAARAEAEAEKAEAERLRAEKAEQTTTAVIEGVEKAKATLFESNLAQYLQDEIQGVATERGVEERLNKMVKKVKRATGGLDRAKLIEKLEE